jgi:hypothetical protein
MADAVPVIVTGDYGADHSALSQHHLDMCAQEGIFVQVLPLRTPVLVELALTEAGSAGPLTHTANSKARVSITLRTKAGDFRLRNVEFLVFAAPMPEVLIGRPVLLSMGFNLDHHLASVRSSFHDTDFSHIGFLASDIQPSLLPTTHGSLANLLVAPTHEFETISAFQSSSSAALEGTDDISAGAEDSEATKLSLEELLADCSTNGLPVEFRSAFRELVHEYADIFRTRLGADPPANVPPMKIKLRPDACPIRVKVRRYSPPQAQFLRSKVDELLRLGLVKANNSSEWACAPLIVPKDGPEGFRFTVDLRPVNMQTIPHTWPMPNLETATAALAGDRCYASIDLCHGYWQMPLEDSSQECQSFITPDGVFTPTRVLHGQTNATSYF